MRVALDQILHRALITTCWPAAPGSTGQSAHPD